MVANAPCSTRHYAIIFATIEKSVADFLDAVDKILNLRTELIDAEVSAEDPYLKKLLNVSGPVLAFISQLHYSLFQENNQIEDPFIQTITALIKRVQDLGTRLWPHDGQPT
ncbi:MAG: hypothetical protein O3C63_01095 [Cyanobacteria bacterium]|nr:hypothetical protein [Cyanobacteriota bacterium]MDA1020685.1 hypothetical protein [Cyanobacteriota bacterium]